MIGPELGAWAGDRDAWNAQHDTRLEAHDNAPTAEQVARINECYAITAYAGIHGSPKRPPTQSEYDQVAAIVGRMQPGDALFAENIGYAKRTREPLATLSYMPKPGGMLSGLLKPVLATIDADVQKSRSNLEQDRQNYRLNAWEYGAEMALLKGVLCLDADLDAFELASLGISAADVFNGTVQGQARARLHALREQKARNTMTDYALQHLPPTDDAMMQGTRKPRLELLFGRAHALGLRKAFDDVGLEATVSVLRQSTDEERQVEHQLFEGRQLPGALAKTSLLGTIFRDLPSLP